MTMVWLSSKYQKKYYLIDSAQKEEVTPAHRCRHDKESFIRKEGKRDKKQHSLWC